MQKYFSTPHSCEHKYTDRMDLKLLSAGDDLKIWDSDFTLTRQFNPHNQNITSACWACDNSFLASVSVHAEEAVITNLVNFETTQLHTGLGCMCIDVNDTTRYMLSGSSDGIISVWDLKSQKVRKTYKGHRGPVTCARFNKGSSAIASGSETGEIIIYNVVTGQGCRPLIAPNVQAIKQVQFSHHKKSLFGSVSDDGAVNLWDANKRQLVHSFTCHRAPTTGLSFSPINDIFLISVGLDKRIACHDVQSKKVVKIMTTDSPLTSIDTKKDGCTIAVGSTRGKIYHYDLRMSSSPVKTIDAHKSSVQCLGFQMDNKVDHSIRTGTSVKQQVKHTGRQLPPPPRDNIENILPVQDARTPMSGIGNDVFSPIREGYLDQSSEEIDYRTSGSLNNISQNARNSTGETYSVGVFSPINDAIGHRSGSGVGLSPLAYSGYPLSEQNRNSPGPNYSNKTSQNGLPVLKITHPSSDGSSDTGQTYDKLTNHSPVSNHVTEETTPRKNLQLSDSQSSSEKQSPSQKHVAFDTDGDTYTFITEGMPLSDSPGSAHGSTEMPALNLPTTPEGVNPQSSVPNGCAYDYSDRQVHSNVKGYSNRKDNRITITDGKTNSVFSGEVGQLAEIIRTVVREELSDFKKDVTSLRDEVDNIKRDLCSVKDQVDDLMHYLHKDIINLQVEMLLKFEMHQTEMHQLLEQYSVNYDLVSEVNRLQEEIKRLKKNF